jgi:hypothetical protein
MSEECRKEWIEFWTSLNELDGVGWSGKELEGLGRNGGKNWHEETSRDE